MKSPIEVLLGLMENNNPNFDKRVQLTQLDWVSKLYREKEFRFVIQEGSTLNKYAKKEYKYKKKLEELNENEIKLLIGNWLKEYDNRPKNV